MRSRLQVGFAAVALATAGAVAVPALGASAAVAGAVRPTPLMSGTGPGANLSASVSSSWQTNGTVWALAAAEGYVFLGGQFTSIRPPGTGSGSSQAVPEPYLAALAANGTQLPALDKTGFGLNGEVTALATTPDGTPGGFTLYVGGTFTMAGCELPPHNTVNCQPRTNLAAFSVDGGYATLLSWAPNPNESVLALAVSPDGSTVYVGGDFGKLAGTDQRFAGAVAGVASITPAPGSLLPWNPMVNGVVTSIAAAPDDTRVLVGGYFTKIGGTTQQAIASTDPATGASEEWGATIVPNEPHCLSDVKDIVISDASGTPTAYVAAEGTGSGCFDGDFAATVGDGTLLWQNDCLGATQALEVVGDWLYKGSHAHDCGYVAGGFPQVENPSGKGPELHRLLDQSLGNGTLGHWTPNTNGNSLGPRVMATDGSQLFVGGDFTTVNGLVQQGFARFDPGAGYTAPPKPPKPVVTSTAKGVDSVTFSAVSDPDVGTLSYAVYRDDGKTPIATLTATSWPWALPVLHCRDAGLKPGSVHTYTVVASTGVKTTSGKVPTSLASAPSDKIVVSKTNPAVGYVATVVASHPSFLWELDETSGHVVEDASPNRFTGIYEPGTTLGVPGPLAGEKNTATAFNGTTGFVTAAKEVAAPKLYSIEAWFKTSTQTGGLITGFSEQQTALSKELATNVYMMNDGQVVFGAWTDRDATHTETIETPNVYNDGHWHFVVATMSASGMSLYVDGQLVGNNPATAVATFTGYWRVGSANLTGWSLLPQPNSQGLTEPNSFFLDGVIGDVAVFPIAISAARVALHYAANAFSH
ncbi:MAG: LamG domain-containing protein [Acidimicrobiales bacterium]